MLKKIQADNALSYGFFAFIAMAGLSYVNFLPGVVSALAGGIGFSEAEAGEVIASNLFGGLLGCAGAFFLVRRIDWRPAMFVLLASLTLVDLSTIWLDSYHLMLGWRFVAGLIGGLSMGIIFSVLARLNSPDRAFGSLLLVQFVVGAVVMYLLPGLETLLGTYAVFFVMAGLAFLSFLLLGLVPQVPRKLDKKRSSSESNEGKAHAILLMLAIVLYLCAANAIWAYVELIGLKAGVDDVSVSSYIASTSLLGLLGAMLPIVSGNRFGRLYWLLAGVMLSIVSAAMLSFIPLTPILYVSAMAMLFFAWPAVNSYLLAVVAELDSSGRLSSLAAVISLLGLATGPLIASGLLSNGDFSVMLYSCMFIFLSSFVFLYKPVKMTETVRGGDLSSQYQS